MRNFFAIACTLSLLLIAASAQARLYSYVNAEGDYIITKNKPKNVDEYAVLTNAGEFIRLVGQRERNVPLSHWRPWFLPKEPHPFDAAPEARERTPSVVIDEVDDRP